MAKNALSSHNFVARVFIWLVFATLLVPLLFTKQLLYPFLSAKALWLRSVVLLALPLYFYLTIRFKSYRPNWKNPLTITVVVFLVLGLISTVTGVNPIRSFWGNYERMDGMYNLLHIGLLYFYLLSLFQSEELLARKFLIGTVVVSFAAAFYAVLEKVGIRFFEDASLPRASSTFGNPIFFASFLILPIFLSAFFALSEEVKWKRNFYWLTSAVSVLGVVFSETRGAFLGLVIAAAVAVLAVLLKAQAKKWRRLGWAMLAVVLVGGAGLFALRHNFTATSSIGRVLNLNDSNAKARLLQWQSGLKGFKDAPLLGVGPQNYYILANKYFNPDIYHYDATWFDKPHNYPLEILLTNGIVGFLAYLSLVVLAFWAVGRAYKVQLISFAESCLLWAGMLAYQIQNLFAFDTPAAAWMFFIFLAFVAYLWQESGPKEQSDNKPTAAWTATAALIAAVLAGLLAIYAWYVTDVVTATVLYNLNYGFAIGVSNPQAAESYYEKAKGKSFIYDLGDLGVKSGEFAVAIGQDQSGRLDSAFINRALDNSIGILEQATARIPNYPIYWYHLANDYDIKSLINKTPVDPKAEAAVQKAIALAPARVEPKFFLVQIEGLKHDIPAVVKTSEEIEQEVPFLPETKWRLALAYKDANRLNDAVTMAEQALSEGYKFKLVAEFRWLINYYADQSNYQKVVELYEDAVKLSPSDYQLYASLATAYAKVGDKAKAIATAEKVAQLNPASQPSVDAFIKSLQ